VSMDHGQSAQLLYCQFCVAKFCWSDLDAVKLLTVKVNVVSCYKYFTGKCIKLWLHYRIV